MFEIAAQTFNDMIVVDFDRNQGVCVQVVLIVSLISVHGPEGEANNGLAVVHFALELLYADVVPRVSVLEIRTAVALA